MNKMENQKYPHWKYKIDFTEVKGQMYKDWTKCFIELHKKIQELKKKIIFADKELIKYIEHWEEDMWVEDKNEKIGFAIIKNDDDWEELEYELHNLYNIAGYKKMIYIQ